MEEQVLNLRQATFDDIQSVKDLFKGSIFNICSKDYSPEQISAWGKRGENDNVWRTRIQDQYFLIAELNQTIIGCVSLTTENYVDVMFVHYNHQGKGIASLLLRAIENRATYSYDNIISVDASITAKLFFKKKGYQVVKEQHVNIGTILINYKMIKYL